MSGAARMLTLDVAGETYRAPRMSALEQFDCLQVATPLLAGLQKKGTGAASVDTVVMGLAGLSEGEVGKLLNLVLAPVERLRDGAWEPFWDADASDAVTPGTDLATIGLVAAHVLVDNLTAFFSYEPAKIERRGAKGPSFKPVSLPGGRSWLLRPALRGVCRFESLVDGTLDLSHVALMNDALSADAENESRARKAAEDARGK